MANGVICVSSEWLDDELKSQIQISFCSKDINERDRLDEKNNDQNIKILCNINSFERECQDDKQRYSKQNELNSQES